jgi:hypothetical protein
VFDLFSYFYIWWALQGIKNRPRIFISIHSTNGRLVQGNNPDDIATGWLSIIDNLSQVDHKKIRANVINRFSFPDCIEKYSSLLKGN